MWTPNYIDVEATKRAFKMFHDDGNNNNNNDGRTPPEGRGGG